MAARLLRDVEHVAYMQVCRFDVRVRLEEVLHVHPTLLGDAAREVAGLNRVLVAALPGDHRRLAGSRRAVAAAGRGRDVLRERDGRRLVPGSGRGNGARVGELTARRAAPAVAAAGGQQRDGSETQKEEERKLAGDHDSYRGHTSATSGARQLRYRPLSNSSITASPSLP